MSEIKTLCKSLRLAYMAEIYEDIPFENSTQFLESLLSKELELRASAKVERLIKKARFLQEKHIQQQPQAIAKCKKGLEVRFYRISDLVADLEKAWREDKLISFHNKFKNAELIILDEMGYVPFSTEGVELFFQLISDQYEQKSLIITSNLEFSQWNRIFSDSRLAAALVDRVIHRAHILNFTGDSFRITHALSRNN